MGWSSYLVGATFAATGIGILLTTISVINVCNDIQQFERDVTEQLTTFKVNNYIFKNSLRVDLTTRGLN